MQFGAYFLEKFSLYKIYFLKIKKIFYEKNGEFCLFFVNCVYKYTYFVSAGKIFPKNIAISVEAWYNKKDNEIFGGSMAISKKTTIDIAVDLGGDSLKLAYGYTAGGTLVLGKIAEEGYKTQIGIPAVAFLSKKRGEWLYGYQVDESGESDFTTVVRIKGLFSLLIKKTGDTDKEIAANEKKFESNKNYFLREKYFPKFYLPKDRESIDDFQKAVDEKRVFEAAVTPRQVCLDYFVYVKSILQKRLEILSQRTGLDFSVRYSVVYPPRVGAEYKKQFKSVLEEVFGCKIHKELGATRALGMHACLRGNGDKPFVGVKENVLVFDIGEEFISTAKIMVSEKGDIVVDGSEGHKKAEPIGGVTVDDAVLNYLEKGVDEREQFASVGGDNSVREGCPESKRYQLLKDIKVAKNILSNEKICGKGIYPNGVEIVVPREFYVQKDFSGNELQTCLGITGKKLGGVADKIYQFIKDEAGAKINEDVKTVIVAGGVIETLGLDSYLRAKLKKELGKNLKTFDDEQAGDDGAFKIYANESSVYAAAIGMTLAAVKDVEIKTVLSLSYGTWANGETTKEKVLKIFVERFAPLNAKENSFSGRFNGPPITEAWMECVLNDEEMFSAVITHKECKARKDEGKKVGSSTIAYVEHNNGYSIENRLVIGGIDSPQRCAVKEAFALAEVFSDEIHIREKSTGKRVRVRLKTDPYAVVKSKAPLKFEEGIIVSKNGTIKPFIKNTSTDCDVLVSYWDERNGVWERKEKAAKLSYLEFYFKDGKNFKAQISDDD